MIEIIPNWHPIFVHFAIGLLSVAALFHVVAAVNSQSTNYYQFESVANWNLWVGALLAIATALAGWVASNSVDHDTPSHLAMMDHRNWAIGTTILFVLLALWSFLRARKSIPINWMFTVVMLIAAGLLATTGWKGGELVYRHGLGVMSLPDKDKHDHSAHSHGDEEHAHGDEEHGHDSLDSSHDSMSMESDSAHEVGESNQAHDHSEENGVENMAKKGVKSHTNGADKKAKDDGHNHDHGDHAH